MRGRLTDWDLDDCVFTIHHGSACGAFEPVQRPKPVVDNKACEMRSIYKSVQKGWERMRVKIETRAAVERATTNAKLPSTPLVSLFQSPESSQVILQTFIMPMQTLEVGQDDN